jgi:hypothetical protein
MPQPHTVTAHQKQNANIIQLTMNGFMYTVMPQSQQQTVYYAAAPSSPIFYMESPQLISTYPALYAPVENPYSPPMMYVISTSPPAPQTFLIPSANQSSNYTDSDTSSMITQSFSSPIWANTVEMNDNTPPIPAIVLDGESISNLLSLAEARD